MGSLSRNSEKWFCVPCKSDYPFRLGFIDFRTGQANDIDVPADSKLANLLEARESSATFSELRDYY